MEKNDPKADDIEAPLENLEELDDTTDWKAKAEEIQKKYQEVGIKNRERTKGLRDRISELEKFQPPAPPEKKTPEGGKSDEFGLLQKTYLRAAGIVAEDEVELARDIQKRTGLDWDKLVDDDYFKTKIEGLRDTKANANATSGISGGAGISSQKNTSEYWIAKGVPPSPIDVPDRKTRAKIARAMMEHAKIGKTFYNE